MKAHIRSIRIYFIYIYNTTTNMSVPTHMTLIVLEAGDNSEGNMRIYPRDPSFAVVGQDDLPKEVRGKNVRIELYTKLGQRIRQTARLFGTRINMPSLNEKQEERHESTCLAFTNIISLVDGDECSGAEDF